MPVHNIIEYFRVVNDLPIREIVVETTGILPLIPRIGERIMVGDVRYIVQDIEYTFSEHSRYDNRIKVMLEVDTLHTRL